MPCSVIIPAYNCESTILLCLNALRNQSIDGFEVIVVDDGSQDQTTKICKSFVNKSKKKFELTILKQKNSGPAKARNKGARIAKHSILIFTDSDCLPNENWLEEMLIPFSDKSVDGVAGSYLTINNERLIARYVGYEIDLRHQKMKKLDYVDFVGTFSAAYRKNRFDIIGGFDESFPFASGEDTDFSFRFSSLGYKIKFNYGAKVGHYHPDTLMKYLRQKFFRGKSSVKLYYKNSKKVIKGDSYTPRTTLIQLLLTPITLFFLISSIFYSSHFIFFVLALTSLTLIVFPTALKMSRYEFIFLFLHPFIVIMRDISIIFGFLSGLFSSLKFSNH